MRHLNGVKRDPPESRLKVALIAIANGIVPISKAAICLSGAVHPGVSASLFNHSEVPVVTLILGPKSSVEFAFPGVSKLPVPD